MTKLPTKAADTIGLALSRHRKNPIVKILDRLAVRLHKGFENSNYDHLTNGELRVLRKIAPTHPKCVFDVGANHGDWAKLAYSIFPVARIHCFEVATPTFQKLSREVGGLDRIRVNNFGLSDQTGECDLYYDPHQDGLTSGVEIVGQSQSSRLAAQVTAGDEYVLTHGITTIDFLKIDVEGMENKVLRGFERSLEAKVIKIIQFEYGLVNIAAKFLLRDFYTFLTRYGFLIGKIYPTYVDFRNYEFKDENFIGPNYLAVLEQEGAIIKALS